MRDPRERLRDILDAMDRIDRYATLGRKSFEESELVQIWIIHHLLVIGEAAAQLGRGIHDAHTDVPWPQIVAMRNLLVHEYFGVDLGEIWKTVERDLPLFKASVERLLEILDDRNDKPS